MESDASVHTLRERVAAIAAERGIRPTARLLGISRETLVTLLAAAPSQAGTIALVRERLRELAAMPPRVDEVRDERG